jgi:hypothetical protein
VEIIRPIKFIHQIGEDSLTPCQIKNKETELLLKYENNKDSLDIENPYLQKKINQQIFDLLSEDIKSCGFFKKEKTERIVEIAAAGIDVPYFKPTQDISQEVVDALTEKGLRQDNIKEIIPEIILKHTYRIDRYYDLLRFKKSGYDYVEFNAHINDPRLCNGCKKMHKKIFHTEKAPLLTQCKNSYCRCRYRPINEGEVAKMNFKVSD